MSKQFTSTRRKCLVAAVLLPMVGVAWSSSSKTRVEVWKDPSCGCCKDWVIHLEKAGFAVRVNETGATAARTRLGIPQNLGSCHTASAEGYALEGHVPAKEIRRLLKERPQAIGLAVPGMHIGSPGMDTPVYNNRKDPYDVLLVKADGSSSLYQSYP